LSLGSRAYPTWLLRREPKGQPRCLRACLSAPWKGAELQWESTKPTRQLTLQPVAAEAGMEAMKCSKPLVQKARKRVSEPAGRNTNEHRASPETI
jgi:hypothetical protein